MPKEKGDSSHMQLLNQIKQIDERILAMLGGLLIGMLFSILVGRVITVVVLIPIFLLCFIFIIMIGAKIIFSSDSK